MQLNMDRPDSYDTCYGCQIKYRMPGGNFKYIHLKDKSKIRHKKRWSQVSPILVNTYLDLVIISSTDISDLIQNLFNLNKFKC